MIAAFEVSGALHVVHVIGRRGLKVAADSYCAVSASAADGVLQVPDWTFDGRATVDIGGRTLHPCRSCSNAMRRLREPPPGSP